MAERRCSLGEAEILAWQTGDARAALASNLHSDLEALKREFVNMDAIAVANEARLDRLMCLRRLAVRI